MSSLTKLSKNTLALALALVLGLTSLTACGTNSASTPAQSATPTQPENPSQTAAPIVYRATSENVNTLSPHQHTLNTVTEILNKVTGSLYALIYDEDTDNMKFICALAEEFPETTDNVTWNIKIKDGLTFTNGKPITAETFEYSWKMLLDPILTSPGAGSIYSSLPIKNAEAYYLRLSEADYISKQNDPDADWAEITPSDNPVTWEDVGIKAIDNNTLQLILANEFTQVNVMSNFIYSGQLAPVDPELYESLMNADRTENTYGTTLETLAQSGPYTLVAWVKDQYRVYEKNPNWANGLDIYTPDVIEEIEISDVNTAVQLFNSGELDILSPSGANAEVFLDDPRALRAEGPVVWGFYINGLSERNPILKDSDFRHALFYATDRETIARDIYKVYIPADYFISRRAVVGNILSNAQRYRDTPEGLANEAPNNGFDTVKALELFDKAYEANGGKKVKVELTYFDTSESQKKCSEFLKEDYERIFGADRFELSLRAMPVEPAYDSYFSRTYDMGFGTMGQDSFNPWSTLNVWSSDSSEKADTFFSPEYDSLQKRGASGDLVPKPEERTKALGRMEELLLDYMPWIPIYQNDGIILYSDRVSVKPTRYITGVGYAPLQADIRNDVPRSITVD